MFISFSHKVKKQYLKWKYAKSGNPLKKILNKYKKLYWDWNIVSKNPNIDIEDFKEYKNLNYAEFLKFNPNVTIQQVADFLKNPKGASSSDINFILFNISFNTDMDTVKKNLNFPWDMRGLAKNPNINLEVVNLFPNLNNFYLFNNNTINHILFKQNSGFDVTPYNLHLNPFWNNVENIKKYRNNNWTSALIYSKYTNDILNEFYKDSTEEEKSHIWHASRNPFLSAESIFKYKEFMNHPIFCENENITLDIIVNKDIKWDCFFLSENINLTLDFIKTKPLSSWCIKKLFRNPCLTLEIFEHCEAQIKEDISNWSEMGSIWTERLYLDTLATNRFLYEDSLFKKELKKDIEQRRDAISKLKLFKDIDSVIIKYISYV